MNIFKWPVLLIITSLIVAVLYWATPNVKQQFHHLISPGSVLALLIWMAVRGRAAARHERLVPIGKPTEQGS